MINGTHALIYAKDAERARAFFRDVLGLDSVDAGQGWLIFALPPAEVGIHPIMEGDDESHELYFMCDDVKKTVAELEKKGVQCAPIQEAGWGLLTSFEVPGAKPMGLYEPRHPLAHGKARPAKKAARKPARKAAAKPAKRASKKRPKKSAKKKAPRRKR
jgi:catechol 2,3-dioxygenase-like lactoylglutathione lyase family enzyme